MTRSFLNSREVSRSFEIVKQFYIARKDFWDILTSYTTNYKEQNGGHRNGTFHRPIRLTQCCTQFESPGDKIICVLHLHYNVAFTFK